jgi:2-polyprenyl-3-methyl-5-hydroxy-6-metoxy-1,4-benzoquinol methylase
MCSDCGVVRLVDRVAESALDVLYAHYYTPRELSREELERQLSNPTFLHRLRRLELTVGSRERRIFEIGCGDGNFLASLQRTGWKVDGSEFSSDTVSQVRDRHGIAVTDVDVTKQVPSSAPYPVVAAYHVLEHVYRPEEWLLGVRKLVEPQGLLHLQVPNWASLTHALTGIAWSSMTFPQHVYFYTPHTLGALLSNCGFDVIAATTWDPWHGPGTTRSSFGSRVRYFVTGQLPWSAAPGHSTNGPGAVETSEKVPWRRVSHALVQVAGGWVARLEALIGRGGVVDFVAKRVD